MQEALEEPVKDDEDHLSLVPLPFGQNKFFVERQLALCINHSKHGPKIQKGWLAIALLKPLSLFIPLFQHCQMLSEALIIEK